jgi:CheY-like chemotaxis protein
MKTVNILMVEDNPGDVVLVQEAVSKAGLPYHIHVARDGVEATDLLLGEGQGTVSALPDLIVLDLKLPRKNGRELLDEIMANPALRNIPLILLSSSRSELESARALHLRAGSYLVKPSTFEGYIALVKTIEAFRRKARG